MRLLSVTLTLVMNLAGIFSILFVSNIIVLTVAFAEPSPTSMVCVRFLNFMKDAASEFDHQLKLMMLSFLMKNCTENYA